MAEGGMDNRTFVEDDNDRGPPPSYPGTPTNFTRKLQPEEQQPFDEKTGSPTIFVEVQPYGPQIIPNYIEPRTIILPTEKITVIDTKGGDYPTKIPTAVTKRSAVKKCDIGVLVLSIFALILFFPLGIPAVILAGLAISQRQRNNSAKASTFTKISIVLSVLSIIAFATAVAMCIAKSDNDNEHPDCGSDSHDDSKSHEDHHRDPDEGSHSNSHEDNYHGIDDDDNHHDPDELHASNYD